MAKNWWEESTLESAAPKNESADEWWSGAKLENAPQRTWGESIKDTGAQLAEGVNTTLGAIPSVVAPQSRAAGFFRDNAQYWRDQQSDVLKDRIAASDQRIQEAGKDGVLSQIGTAASEYWNDPAQAARLVATNLPSMAATLGTGAAAGLAAKGVAAARGLDAANKAALAAKYGTTTAAATNAALNAGGARGEAFEDSQKAAIAQGMTPEQAEQAGVSGSILPGVVGGVAGAISGKIGLEKAILGQATTGAAMRRAAGAFGAELAGEQIEELAPKVATNYQVGRIDPGRTLTDDLGRTMVETAIGSGPGAVVAGGASAMRTGETPPPPGAGEPTTSPGAADPNAPQQPLAAPAAQSVATPMPAPILDESVLEAAGVRPPAYINTRNMDRMLGDIPMSPTSDLGADSLEADTRTPSERMGINPAAGALSRAAAVAVDSGATPVQFLGATGRDLQARATGPGVTNESNVIDVQGRLVEDRAISTPRRLTDQQDGMAARAQGDRLAIQPPAAPSAVPALGGPVGADAARGGTTAVPDASGIGGTGPGPDAANGAGAAETGAARPGGRGDGNQELSAPTNLRDALVRVRAQKQEAARLAQVPPTQGAQQADGVDQWRKSDETNTADLEEAKTISQVAMATLRNANARQKETERGSLEWAKYKLESEKAMIEIARANVLAYPFTAGPEYQKRVDNYEAFVKAANEFESKIQAAAKATQPITGEGAGVASRAKLQAKQVPPTQGANLVHQAPQAQQTAAQPTQAGAAPAADAAPGSTAAPTPAGTSTVRALSDGAPAENIGAQAAPAAGAQAQAPGNANWAALTPEQRRRARLEHEIATGQTNNGGVVASLRPSAIEKRKQELAAMGDAGKLPSPGPAESAEQRTQRVTKAGEAWTRMPAAQREALAGIAAGLNQIQRKRVPSAAWADLNRTIQSNLADAMGGREEYGGNQAGTSVNTAPVAINSEADQIAEAVSKADRLDLKGAERAQWVHESLSVVWGMTPDEVRDVPAVAAALKKKPSKEDSTAASVRAVERVVRQAEQAVAADGAGAGDVQADRVTLKKAVDSAYRVANGYFGSDFVGVSIQNDWQRLLDAAGKKDVQALIDLESKYRKDEERDGMGAGTSGAGPGKVKQARRGAAQIPRFAREIRQAIGADLSKNPPNPNTSAEPVQETAKTAQQAEAAPAATPQGVAQAAPAAVAERPKNWRTSMLGATPVAKAMGIDTKGKRLAQVVAEIDARDTQAPATPAPAPAPGPTRLGRDNTPLSEGGKPFKTRKAAGDAKKLQPMMRVVTVPGGYALAEKTPAQLAAEERAAKRLRTPRTSPAGEPVPAHAFIAASGGLHMRHRNDLGVDGNPRIGNRRLFGGLNSGLSIEQATEMLVADGYLSEGASHNDAYALIKKSLSQPQYNADGIERIAESDSTAMFEDYMAAQEEMTQEDDGFDPFGLPPELTAEDLDAEGYTTADPALQAEVNALVAQAEAAGIDTYDVLDDIVRTYANATQDQYNAAAREALAAAIARSNQDGGGPAPAAAPAAPRSEPEQGLNRPSALDQQAQAATKTVAPTNAQEGIAAAQAKAARFAIGKSLTKEQRKQVLESLVDTYKTKGAEREFKGLDSNGNDRYGYVYSPELFEKSDITGAMVRYYVTLPDGRIAHPTELFQDVSASDVERMALEQESKKKAQEAYENAIKPFYPDFDSANLMATTGQVVISKGDRLAIIPDRTGAVGQARQQGWEVAKQAQTAIENVVPESLELAAQTPAEAAARQDAQEQADKAEAAAKRAEDAAAKAEEERKRIAQASVRAADRFELGQDPMDSLTGQGGLAFSFAGARAATADKHALVTAQDRLSAGEDAETVRQETGWFQGKDGKWRFEIGDADARLKDRTQWTAKIDGINAKRDAALQALWQAKEQRNDFLRARGESPSRISSETKKTPEFKALAKALKNAEAAAEKAQDAAFLARQGDSLITVGDVLSHPALFAAYPGIADVRVDINDSLPAGNAAYAYELRAIELSGKSDAQQLLSTLLHEIQHGIQHIEGFASGGPSGERMWLGDMRPIAMAEYQKLIAEINRPMSLEEYARQAWGVDSVTDEIRQDYAQNFVPSHMAALERKGLDGDLQRTAGWRAYRRLAGEVEARNTQARQKLTADQRRVTSPGSTADVADADVIVVFNGKEMANAPMPANAAPDAATTAQPLRTPAATIRAAITKAYGKLLGQLESKGLVTLTQTQEQAIEAAAQARAAKTGQSVEQARSTLRASVKNSVADQTQTEAFSRGKNSAVENKNAPTSDTSDAFAGRPNNGMQERAVRAVAGSPELAQFSEAGSDAHLSTLRTVDVFGNGNMVEYYDDAKGLMYSMRKYPRGERWTAWDIFPAEEGGNQVIGEFDRHHSFADAVKSIRSARISASARARLAKYSAVPNTWNGDAKKLAKALIDAGVPIDHFANSTQSRSRYIYLDDGRKIRLADHDLPSAYDSPDYDYRYGIGSIAQLVEQIKSETGNNGNFDPDIRRSADGSIQGFFDPQTGQSFLIADNLTAEAAPGVLMHEVGIHMAADGSMKALFNRAAMMLKLQRGNPFMKAVQDRMDAAGETSGEEAAAYIAEAYENDRANAPASVQRWLADLLAAVKAWMFKKGIMGADRLTVADIAAVARANARSMARDGGATGGQGFGTAFSRAPAGDQTQTDSFKRWFAGSRVVDADGKPLRVYHGTTKDFDAFDQDSVGDNFGRDNDGFFFTGSAVEASGYADPQSELLAAGRPDARRMTPLAQANVMPVYLSIKNPLTLERYTWAIASSPEVEIDESGVSLIDFFDSGNGDVTRYAKEKGHDGVLFKRGGETLAVAFFPEQIKSATGNRGTFGSKPSAFDGNVDSFSAEVLSDGLAADADFLRNFASTRTFKKFGLDGFDIPSNGLVFKRVSSVLQDFKIRDAVIKLIPVDVMNILISQKLSPDVLLNDVSVLSDLLSTDSDNPVTLVIGESTKVARAIAGVTAKYLASNSDLRVLPTDRNSAMGTQARQSDALVDGITGVRAKNPSALRNTRSKAADDGRAIGAVKGFHDGLQSGEYSIAYNADSRLSTIENFDPANPDIRFSRTTDAAKAVGDTLKSITVSNVKQRAGFKLTDYLGIGLQALGRRQIVDIYGDMLPLAEYNTLVTQMEADKNEGGAEADKLVTRWAELPDEGKLADLMHEATLAQIDPAKPYVGGDDKAKYAMLAGRFNALSQEARQVYTDTRDAYQGHHAKVRSAIKERIERSELKGPRKAELLKQMDDEFFAAVNGVYFPLARFGQYAVTVKGADGKVESVSRAETKAEAEALRNSLLSAFPRDKGFTVGRVMLSKDFIADRDAVGRGFMTELYQVLDKQDMDAAQRAELEDTLGQLYLSSLPDLSWAKHGIHRKGTPGFSQDARRAFAQNMFHGSRYLAKLRYSDLMQDELTAMQKHVDDWREVEDFDQNSAQRVVDEMNKRHESLMNPKSNALSTALTSFGFIFHLGLSPASAMVNLSQTALVAYPIMGAKWGFSKASAALLKASAEATKGKNDITGSLNADERAAYDEAVRAGTIDVTMAHDLAGIAQGEDAGVMWKIRPVMRWASFLFHHAERFNRQVTFVAAYRLAREAGADHHAAFEQATKATYDGHFDYGAANRPRFMQGNVAKVLLLFKQYGQNMVYTLARNAQQAIKGESPEVRAQARKALGGLLATHAAAAGVLGLPMVTTLLAAASMIGGDDDEPWDAKVALQNMLADTFGQKPAEVLAHGLSRMTPWDISGRVGLDRLILPDVQEGLEGRRLAESAMTAALGPVAGIGVNLLNGAQHMSEGRYALGLEAMLPSALRGPVKAIRYANEGVQDKSGISILDEVGPAAVAGQALGFSPSQARNAQEGKSAVMAQDRALGERRQELLTKAARAAMAKDAEALAEARKEIAGFNEKNPGRRITPLNITQSVRNRQKRIDQSQDGVYLPKNRMDAMEAGRFALGG